MANWGDVRWYDPLTAGYSYQARRGGEVGKELLDTSVDMSPWDRQRAEVERILGERPAYQSAYTPDWLKTRQAQIDLQTRGLLDETQAGQLAEQRSAWDQLAMNSGLDKGAAERLGARAAQNAQINRQGVFSGQAQQNLQAQMDDYNLRAQDIAARNAHDMAGWQTRAQTMAGLAQGENQFRQTAPKRGFIANLFS